MLVTSISGMYVITTNTEESLCVVGDINKWDVCDYHKY